MKIKNLWAVPSDLGEYGKMFYKRIGPKLFKNGQSQAVRLPKEFRFENMKEVFIKKVGGMVILIPKSDKKGWNSMFDSLEYFSDDFMQERTQPTQEREDPF